MMNIGNLSEFGNSINTKGSIILSPQSRLKYTYTLMPIQLVMPYDLNFVIDIYLGYPPPSVTSNLLSMTSEYGVNDLSNVCTDLAVVDRD